MKKFCLIFAVMVLMQMTAFAAFGGTIDIDQGNVPVYTLQKGGSDNECFVILLLGDGYTDTQQGDFLIDAKNTADLLLKIQPYMTYSDKINIYAVPTVSNETGASYAWYTEKDTYYGVTQYLKAGHIRQEGKDRARAIKTQLENSFLDSGAVVGTIHIISNSTEYFAASENSLFSCAALTDIYTGGIVSVHELAHSIGGLKDEYNKVSDGANASLTGDKSAVLWKNFLGFNGVGITLNGNHESSFIPTLSCIMQSLDNSEFCEVCKSEIVRRMNSKMYTLSSDKYYVATPDVTIEHSDTGTIGKEYEKCRIFESNINCANSHNLEFRTVVQNLENIARNFKLTFAVYGSDGTEKYYAEKDFVVPPLENEYDYYTAQMSMSVVLENVSGLCIGDKITARVIDSDTNTVVATDKSRGANMCKVTINHKFEGENAENVYATTVYVPKGTVYTPKTLTRLNGMAYVGNSLNGGSVTVNDNTTAIDFHYENVKKAAVYFCDYQNTVYVTPCGINPGTLAVCAFYNGEKLSELKIAEYNGNNLKFAAKGDFSYAKIMLLDDGESLSPLIAAEITEKSGVR